MDFHHERELPTHMPIFQEHTYLGVTFSEASGLLLLSSFFILNEGLLRYMPMVSTTGKGIVSVGSGEPPSGLLYFGSLLELALGILGILLGVAGFIFRFYNTRFVQSCMAIQATLSVYIFTVFVVVKPVFDLANTSVSPIPSMSLFLYRFLFILSIMASAHFAVVLKAAQFIFMARMISAATGDDFLRQRSGDRFRAAFWSLNIALAGLWTFITGIVLLVKMTGADTQGKLTQVFSLPPNIGRIPGMTITAGLLLFLFGIAGFAYSALDVIAPQVYYVAAVVVFMFTWINFTVGQLSFVGPETSAASGNSALVFMIVFMATYFVWCYSKETGFSDDKM